MSFDYQPILKGELIELRPLRAEDYDDLYAVAVDPLIWEQHPAKNRHEEGEFQVFFREALASGGALIAIDANTQRVIGSSRFHGYDEERSEVEIGWTFLARSHWGGSYNGEMKQLMLQHAFRFVSCVVFLVGPQNLRSNGRWKRPVLFGWGPGATLAAGIVTCTKSLLQLSHSRTINVAAAAPDNQVQPDAARQA